MNREKSFKIIKALIVIFVAVGMGFAIAIDNPIAAIIIFVIGIFLLFLMRNKFKGIIVKDERMQRISEKAYTSAFLIFAFCITIVNIVIIFLEPFDIEFINQIRPAIYQFSLAWFIIFALYWIFYLYYQRKM